MCFCNLVLSSLHLDSSLTQCLVMGFCFYFQQDEGFMVVDNLGDDLTIREVHIW